MFPLRAFSSLLVCSAAILRCVSAEELHGSVLNNETEAFIHRILSGYASPGGVGVAVVRRGSDAKWAIETKGYGVAKLADGSKVTENTRFAIGSNSKLIDAIATGLLVYNQSISPPLAWNTKLASVIPGFGLEDSVAFKGATIIDALSHRTGLPRHDLSYRRDENVTSIINKVKNQRPSAEFREVWQYTNNMYTILSYLPTALLPSKIPYARYVKEHIFDPLGMSSTTYSSHVAAASGQLADGMARQFINTGGAPSIPRALPYFHPNGEDGSFLSGAGGAISTPVDMAIWLQALLLNGVGPKTNTSVIPAEVIQTVSTGISVLGGAAAFPELSPTVYGGGQIRGTYRGHEYVEHNGAVPGFSSRILRLPQDDVGIAVLTNDDELGLRIAELITYRLLDEALALEPIDWQSRLDPIYEIIANLTTSTPRPVNATFPLGDLSSVAGKYTDAGYGPFELCLVSPKDTHASLSCNALAANISTVLPGTIPADTPTFYAAWDHPFFSHIRLTHFDGPIFNVSVFASYPTGNTSVPFWSFDLGSGPTGAHAIVDDKLSGVGFFGIWGAGDVTAPQGNTPQERAEVWFEKV